MAGLSASFNTPFALASLSLPRIGRAWLAIYFFRARCVKVRALAPQSTMIVKEAKRDFRQRQDSNLRDLRQ